MSSDPQPWISALRSSHDRLASLVQSLSPEQLQQQSYDSEWSVAQVLSHIGSGAEISALLLTSALTGGELDREAFPAIWDVWNNRTPGEQAAECLAHDEEYVRRLEQLSPAELDSISVDFFGLQLDAAGLVGLRLGEHTPHTWDVAVSIDPAATLSPDAVVLLLDTLPRLLRFAGKPAGDSVRLRVRTTSPDRDYLLDIADSVTISDWAPGQETDGGLRLPAEALMRLVYGRLDPEHTPPLSADGIDLDRLRKIFPGF